MGQITLSSSFYADPKEKQRKGLDNKVIKELALLMTLIVLETWKKSQMS